MNPEPERLEGGRALGAENRKGASSAPVPNPQHSTPSHTQLVEPTGMPWPRTWPGVYWLVAGSFVLYVVLLALLTAKYS